MEKIIYKLTSGKALIIYFCLEFLFFAIAKMQHDGITLETIL